jgi:hypothetical protein
MSLRLDGLGHTTPRPRAVVRHPASPRVQTVVRERCARVGGRDHDLAQPPGGAVVGPLPPPGVARPARRSEGARLPHEHAAPGVG